MTRIAITGAAGRMGRSLIEACQHVFAAAATLPVRTGPHVVASLCREDQLIPVGSEIGGHDPAEALLGCAVLRAVVVGKIEVCDPAVEGVQQHLSG